MLPEYPASHQLPCTPGPEVSKHHCRLSNPKDTREVGEVAETDVACRYGQGEALRHQRFIVAKLLNNGESLL